MPQIIDTFEKALTYPSELLRTQALRALADLEPSDPYTANLLSLAARYKPQMSEANQRRVKHLCRCLVQSSPCYDTGVLHTLAGEEESSESSESSEKSVDWGEIAKAIGTTASSITGSALTYANQSAQRETQMKLLEAQQKASQDALAKQQAALATAQQAAAAKLAATAPRPGLKPPLSVSKPMALWVKVLIGLLVAAIAAGGVVYWRKRALVPAPASAPKTPQPTT